MPRNKEQNEEIRRQRQEAIIRGALKVYVEKGYAAAEIGDVAEHAGVARGLVYYYFKDKQTLFRELFTYMFDLSKKHVQSHFAKDGSVKTLLETFIRTMYSSMLEQSESVLFFMRMRHDLRELFTSEEITAWSWRLDNMNVIREVLEKGMASGEIRQMTPGLLATQLWGAIMHGLMHFRQVNRELEEQGLSKMEIARATDRDIQDAIACCMSMITPPSGEKSSGDDKG